MQDQSKDQMLKFEPIGSEYHLSKPLNNLVESKKEALIAELERSCPESEPHFLFGGVLAIKTGNTGTSTASILLAINALISNSQ